MSHIMVKEIDGAEMLDVFYRLPGYAFTPSQPFSDPEERRERLRSREGHIFCAAYENGEAVACAASTPLTQNVRGALFPAGGILDVATLPQARRRGHASRVVRHLLGIARERGRPLSCLYPFNEAFYETLGYVQFPQPWIAIVDPGRLLSLPKLDLMGEVEICLLKKGYAEWREFLASVQQGCHGMALFEGDDFGWAESDRFWLARAQVEGATEAAMLYQLKGDRIMDFTMRCRYFSFLSQRGKYLLLSWIGRHANQASRAEVWLPTWEHPGQWWTDLKVTLEPAFVAPMGRVLDVAALGGMEVGPGELGLEVRDTVCPWNQGTWRFASEEGRLVVSPASEAQGRITIQGLAALIYGTHDPGAFGIRGWGDVPPQVQAAMRTMFPGRVPYLHEQF